MTQSSPKNPGNGPSYGGGCSNPTAEKNLHPIELSGATK